MAAKGASWSNDFVLGGCWLSSICMKLSLRMVDNGRQCEHGADMGRGILGNMQLSRRRNSNCRWSIGVYPAAVTLAWWLARKLYVSERPCICRL